mgnify:CR=1 FL=1
MSWISVFFTRKKPIANRYLAHLMLPILLLIGQTALVEDAAAASLNHFVLARHRHKLTKPN